MDTVPQSHLPLGPYVPPPASVLTEDAIKRAFLPFLKQFYKFRYEYRPETITAELDNVSTEGWVADGMVQFTKEDGSVFTCTYEATSLDKAGEVKFSQNVPYFLWDCAAFGVFSAAVMYSVSYVVRFRWLVNLQWNGNAGLLIGLSIIGFLGWFFLMRKWKKYRYIYAIEQFKRYFADEQWVALGDDVFPSPIDPYLVELKEQCVYNGFGLALVSMDGQVRPLATPSRIGIYGKDRKMTQWVTRTAFYQALSKNINTLSANRPKAPDAIHILWNQIWRPIQRFVIQPVKQGIWRIAGSPAEKPTAVFDRFMSANTVQKWMLGFSLTIIGLLGYRVLNFTEDSRYGEVKNYRSDLLTGNPEDQNYSLDQRDEPVPYVSIDRNGIPKQYPEPPFGTPSRTTDEPVKRLAATPKKEEEEVQSINLSGAAEEDNTPTINLSTDKNCRTAKAPKLPSPKPVADPCARLYEGWFVQDNVFSSQGFADERLAALKKAGITCARAPRTCVDNGKSGYLVWLGVPQKTEAAARQKADGYEKTMKKLGILRGPLLVRKISQ